MSIDFGPWHALQEWLHSHEQRVTIPFAESLAELIPPVAVRLRRDFPAMLNLIRAHALLHQATRERDAIGRIIATLADYNAVRELVSDLMAEAFDTTVLPTMRETVHAVQEYAQNHNHGPATVAAVAAALKLDKSAAWRRVQSALQKGYLRNLEDKKGRPAQLVIGERMPDDVAVLPEIEVLDERCRGSYGRMDYATTLARERAEVEVKGCTVAGDTGGMLISPVPADAMIWRCPIAEHADVPLTDYGDGKPPRCTDAYCDLEAVPLPAGQRVG